MTPQPPPLAQRLRCEQVQLLAQNVPALVVGTLILALGVVALLASQGQALATLLIWLAVMGLLCAARLLMLRRWRRDPTREQDAERWARAFVLASASAGLCWGSLAWFFFAVEQPFTLAIVAIVLMSILSSATQSLGPYFPAHLAFALPCALPFALRCLASGPTALFTLGLLTLVYLAMAELFARRIASAIADALRLRLDNDSLVDQLRLEKQRAEAAHLSKTRFLAAASHDLRQPVHAMGLFVPTLRTLAGQASPNPRVLNTVAGRLQAALDTMGELLGRLLDISRLDSGALTSQTQVVPLNTLLQRVAAELEPQALAKGLRLRVRDGGLAVLSDPAMLHTILSNLAGNAVRYTEHGGVLLAARRRGDRVRLEVWDSGIGIAAEQLPRIAEEFYRVGERPGAPGQAPGFGLGLSIAQRSAELLGSALQMRSAEGQGSVFSLELPGSDPPPASRPRPNPPAQAPAPAAPRRRVLVVDDDEQIRAAMSFLLSSWGHEALLADSLPQALRVAQDTPPDLALIDLRLGSEGHGLQVVAALRQRLGAHTPMAIVTGDTTADTTARLLAAGVTGLHKPLDPERLQQFLVQTLVAKPAPPEPADVA